jgi:hypothetical protein
MLQQDLDWRHDNFLYNHDRYINVEKLSDSMEPSASWEANSTATTQDYPNILWIPKIHYRSHKSPPVTPIMSRINPVHTIPLYLSKICLILWHVGPLLSKYRETNN